MSCTARHTAYGITASCVQPRSSAIHQPPEDGCAWPDAHHPYAPSEETMPIPRDMETIADHPRAAGRRVRRAKEDEAARLSAPVRAFRIRCPGDQAIALVDGDILHLHADGSLTLEIGTEVFRGAR